MVIKTLFEKMDPDCSHWTLKESIVNQVRRIVSTRMYLGSKEKFESWVTGFGVPEVVGQHADTGNQHEAYRALIRKKILTYEPRLTDVTVKQFVMDGNKASCQLVMKWQDGEIEEQFIF